MKKIIYGLAIISLIVTACEHNIVDINDAINEDGASIDTTLEDNIVDNNDSTYLGTVPVDKIDVISYMTNEFGWKLFQQIAKGVTDKNVIISPLSVQVALSMVANGANGATVEEILKVLGCKGCELKGLNEQTAALRSLMEEQSGNPRLISANAFFYDPQKLDIKESFEQVLVEYYRSEIKAYDFSSPSTLLDINEWVKENTNNKIDKILEKINEEDLAFIINALHFKAEWSNGFPPYATFSYVFENAKNQDVVVEYLNSDYYFLFARDEYFNLVDVMFKDSTYSLSLVQPISANQYNEDWISSIDSKRLTDLWSLLSPDRINLTLPKFEVEFEQELIDPLKQLGISKAFSPFEANFSNLGNSLVGPRMYIGQARHKAILKIDEYGAEGGAVTAFGIVYDSAPPQLTFDKPFVIVLRHRQTNTILFAGRINDPSL